MGTAALHAGLLTSGQTGTINIASAGWQTSYTGTTRYGVTTSSYSGFCGVNVSLASAPPPSTCSVPNKVGSTWTQGSASCQGDSQTASAGSTISNGQSFTVFDNTQYDTGSQTYLCSSGTVAMTSISCTTSAAPLNVTFDWLVGGWGNGMRHFSVTWSGSGFPITVSFSGETYWYDQAVPSSRYSSYQAVFSNRTWYGSHTVMSSNGSSTVCVGTGTYGGYSVNGVFPYKGSCDLTQSASGYNSGWLFPPGNYGTGTLEVRTVIRDQYKYTGTGTASPNPAISTTSAPISGSWTANPGGMYGSFTGTLNKPSSGDVTYTNSGGTIVTGGSVTKGW